MRSAVGKQSGEGPGDGATSEVAAFFDVLPGHQEELCTAAQRFTEVIRNLDPSTGIRTGLRDTRHVIFDDGFRLLWCASFEGRWDAWVDDGLFLIGADYFASASSPWAVCRSQSRGARQPIRGRGAEQPRPGAAAAAYQLCQRRT